MRNLPRIFTDRFHLVLTFILRKVEGFQMLMLSYEKFMSFLDTNFVTEEAAPFQLHLFLNSDTKD